MSTVDSATQKKSGSPNCKEPACTIAVDGRCYEGLKDPKSCPNFIVLEAERSEENQDDIEELENTDEKATSEQELIDSLPPTIDLYGGMELEYQSSLRITLADLARVIVLAGPNDSGKTTLLTSIYEHFLCKPLAGYMFAGSETLRAFEYRCHLSRVDSQRDNEDTERTKSFSEQTMLHLCVRDEAFEHKVQHLLLSDIRGELFVQAMNSTTDCQRIKVLKRADHICIIVDGAKLAELNSRNQATVSAKQSLRSFLESGMISSDTYVDVLFTKDDVIKTTEEQFNTSEFLNSFEKEMTEKYGSQVRRIRFLRIAARPDEGLASYGLVELFSCWVRDCAFQRPYSIQAPRVITSNRSFDQFAMTQLPGRYREHTS